jgi:aspartate racemase
VFGIRPIGVQDDFFELGGHSVLAMELFSEIQKHTGRALPVTTLLETPTIEGLAQRLRQEGWSASRSSLVLIQPLGANPPLFYVPPAAMTILPMRKLAEYLGSEQPVYGLEPLGLDGAASPHRRVEDMAAYYIAQIRGVQPEGPHFLAGQCFGGVVVFEMAQQLRANGQEVALLALLDAIRRPGLREELHPPVSPGVRVTRFLRRSVRRLRTGGKLLALYLSGRRQSLTRLVRTRARRLFRGFLPPQRRRTQRVLDSHYHAMRLYRARVYPGTITCFWSEKMEAEGAKVRSGWQALSTSELEIHLLPCTHDSMLSGPSVRGLAEELGACIEKASSSRRRPAAPPQP